MTFTIAHRERVRLLVRTEISIRSPSCDELVLVDETALSVMSMNSTATVGVGLVSIPEGGWRRCQWHGRQASSAVSDGSDYGLSSRVGGLRLAVAERGRSAIVSHSVTTSAASATVL